MDIPERGDKGEKKELKTGGSIESSNPNIAVIILNIHKVELLFQGRDFQIGSKGWGEGGSFFAAYIS